MKIVSFFLAMLNTGMAISDKILCGSL